MALTAREGATVASMFNEVELLRQYIAFPLGAMDASIVALAERLDIDTIATLDHAHFRAIRPRHVESFTLLP